MSKISSKPSDFLQLGLPTLSIFGEAWHEMTAVAYLTALARSGDTWSPLTPEQVRNVLESLPYENQVPGLGSILANTERLQAVADKLTSAEDAVAFSWAWRRVRSISS